MPAVQSRRFRTSAEPVRAAGDRKAPAESAQSRPAPGWNATVSTGVRHAGTQALDLCCRQELANLWEVPCRPGLHYQGSGQTFRRRTSNSQRWTGSRVPVRPPPQRGGWAARISAVAVPLTPAAQQRRFRTGAEPGRAAACRRGRAGSARSRRAPGWSAAGRGVVRHGCTPEPDRPFRVLPARSAAAAWEARPSRALQCRPLAPASGPGWARPAKARRSAWQVPQIRAPPRQAQVARVRPSAAPAPAGWSLRPASRR
jgi:hypothetical protein